jgi:hypothetical protein
MASYFVPKSQEIFFQTMVELGGGVYRGVQQGDAKIKLTALILFDGPSKSTLALKPGDVSARRVREEIQKKEREFEAFAEKACRNVFQQFRSAM